MIKIAICDDDEVFCHDLEQKLYQIFCQEKWLDEIEVFFDGETMFKYMKNGNRYDLVFLDIELKKISGVTVGNAIRKRLQDEDTQIVYISAKESYAMELFAVRPLDFLIKPISEERLKRVIIKSINLRKEYQDVFEYQVNHHMHYVAYKEIVYFEVRNRQVYIHMKNSTVWYYGKLSAVMEKVKKHRFLRVSRSELVHYDAIEQYSFDKMRLSGNIEIIINFSRRKMIQEEMIAYARSDALC